MPPSTCSDASEIGRARLQPARTRDGTLVAPEAGDRDQPPHDRPRAGTGRTPSRPSRSSRTRCIGPIPLCFVIFAVLDDFRFVFVMISGYGECQAKVKPARGASVYCAP
jgi:hypothetical protein